MVNIFNKLFSNKKTVALAEATPSNKYHDTPIGKYGTQVYGGYLQEDYLTSLSYTLKADIYDKMRRSDYNVIMLLRAVKNPIKAAHWEFCPCDDTEESKQDAKFITHVFDDMKHPFKKFIGEALTMVDFGHSVFEITHKIVPDSEFGSYVGLKELAWRSPRTIYQWNVDPSSGDLTSITQIANGDLDVYVDIPVEFLIYFNIDQEGANFEGISMLRACYGNWIRKNNSLKLNAAGIEKYAIPTPVATIPEGMQGTQQFANLVSILEAYTSHQTNFITIPKGWEIDFNSNGSYDPSKVENSVDSEDKRMSKAFLANFLELIGGGSYALSQDLSDFFLSGLDHLANEIADKINMQLIPHLIDINFGPRKTYPKLKFSGISDKLGIETAQVLSQLINQKAIVPDDKLEDHLRLRYSLPVRSDEGQRIVDSSQNSFTQQFSERLSVVRMRSKRP